MLDLLPYCLNESFIAVAGALLPLLATAHLGTCGLKNICIQLQMSCSLLATLWTLCLFCDFIPGLLRSRQLSVRLLRL